MADYSGSSSSTHPRPEGTLTREVLASIVAEFKVIMRETEGTMNQALKTFVTLALSKKGNGKGLPTDLWPGAQEHGSGTQAQGVGFSATDPGPYKRDIRTYRALIEIFGRPSSDSYWSSVREAYDDEFCCFRVSAAQMLVVFARFPDQFETLIDVGLTSAAAALLLRSPSAPLLAFASIRDAKEDRQLIALRQIVSLLLSGDIDMSVAAVKTVARFYQFHDATKTGEANHGSAGFEACRREAVHALVELMTAELEVSAVAAEALDSLACTDELRSLAANCGALDAAVVFFSHETTATTRLLQPQPTGHNSASATACVILRNLSLNDALLARVGEMPKAVHGLTEALKQGGTKASTLSVATLSRLSASSPASLLPLVDLEVMRSTVSLLSCADWSCKADCAAMLGCLVARSETKSLAIKVDALTPLIQLLLTGCAVNGESAADAAAATLRALDIGLEGIKQIIHGLDESSDSKLEVCEALRRLVRGCSDQLKQLVFDSGAASLLISMLSDGSTKVASSVAATIADVADSSNLARLAVELNAIPPLVLLLASDCQDAVANASKALGNLTRGGEIQMVVARAGGVPALVKALSCHSCEARKHVAAVLRRMSLNDWILDQIARADPVEGLVALLVGPESETLMHAAGTLRNLACRSIDVSSRIVEVGGIGQLAGLLQNCNQAIVMEALATLSGLVHVQTLRDSPQFKKQVADAGVIPVLIRILKICDDDTVLDAATVLRELDFCSSDIQELVFLPNDAEAGEKQRIARIMRILADSDDEMRRSIGDAGAISELVALLATGDEQTKLNAVSALASLSSLSQDRSELIADAGAIGSLSALLSSPAAQNVALTVLGNMAATESLRLRLMNSEAFDAIISVLQECSGQLKDEVAWVLSNLAKGGKDLKLRVARSDVIEQMAVLHARGNVSARFFFERLAEVEELRDRIQASITEVA